MTSAAARAAFDIHEEPDQLRDSYGRNSLGQSCLMARRLVGAGVRCVTIDHTNWDTHDNNFNVLKTDLLPILDKGMAGLLTDLSGPRPARFDSGRRHRRIRPDAAINQNAGRDHWGPSTAVALAGGGIQGGRVVGKIRPRSRKTGSGFYDPQTWPPRCTASWASTRTKSFTPPKDGQLKS